MHLLLIVKYFHNFPNLKQINLLILISEHDYIIIALITLTIYIINRRIYY